MKIAGIIAKWVFILCLPVLLFTASIGWSVNSPWLYGYGFYRHNVSQTTGIVQSELDRVAREMVSYFNSGEEYINITVIKDGKQFELLNQKEILHLKDVKELIRLDYWLLLGTLIYALGYAGTSLYWRKRRYWRQLACEVVGGSVLTLALMLALGLGTLFGFDQLFWQFHLISFTNELWLLDPTRDYLIMLFPPELLYDAFLFWALGTVVLVMVLGGISWNYLRVTRQG